MGGGQTPTRLARALGFGILANFWWYYWTTIVDLMRARWFRTETSDSFLRNRSTTKILLFAYHLSSVVRFKVVVVVRWLGYYYYTTADRNWKRVSIVTVITTCHLRRRTAAAIDGERCYATSYMKTSCMYV